MTTLTGDYARMARILEGHTLGHPVEDRGVDGVYVDFAFNAALVIETRLEDDGQWWYVTMYEWAMDHGVNAEEEVARVRFLYVPAAVVDWLSDYEEEQRKLQAYFEQREVQERIADMLGDER